MPFKSFNLEKLASCVKRKRMGVVQPEGPGPVTGQANFSVITTQANTRLLTWGIDTYITGFNEETKYRLNRIRSSWTASKGPSQRSQWALLHCQTSRSYQQWPLKCQYCNRRKSRTIHCKHHNVCDAPLARRVDSGQLVTQLRVGNSESWTIRQYYCYFKLSQSMPVNTAL